MGRHSTALAVLLAVACGAACSGLGKVTLKVSHAELQERLDRRFPVAKSKSVFEVVLMNPQLELVAKRDELQLTITAQPSALGTRLGESNVTVRGGVRYDKQSKSFYLTDPQVRDVDVAEIPERYHDKLRRAIDLAVREVLPTIPIYKVNKNTFRHSLNRAFLKRAWVEDHDLHLEMGL